MMIVGGRAWAFEDLRLSVLTLALTDDEGRVVDWKLPSYILLVGEGPVVRTMVVHTHG